MRFNDWFRNNKEKESELEFFEDTHDAQGNYIGQKYSLFSPKQTSVDFDKPKYGNIVVYKPATPEEVETVINFLRRGEPAVANLNDLAEADAQRILDFLSGAVFALGGNVHRITENIFLLSPSGVEIQSYYDKDK